MQDKTKLWHLRLGHISERGFVELNKQKLLEDDRMEELEFCDHCILGKSYRLKFETGKHVYAHASVASQTMQDKTKLWHLRLRHISERGLVELNKQKPLGDDRMEKLEFCGHCIMGKSYRLKFETSMYPVDHLSMLTRTCGV
ncbi:uncharacterized protein LOC113874851 [Abrus precatorius]|uniref:Uncharacterized protein LOC113874851 n=1 Tax=Abrus precatorius TaxID=3816 RepID=A0A8B8MJF5_ABRPR|nr:uncharacterized protein LOC113874851 [Abrus precatorius]